MHDPQLETFLNQQQRRCVHVFSNWALSIKEIDMTTINVPTGAPNRIGGRGGRAYSTRSSNGRTVVDVLPEDIESLLTGPEGKAWSKANPGLAVSMLAPEGVTSYSHGGTEVAVGKDRLVVVTDEVAQMLRSHGFRDTPGS
jgi:hypothetical protein